MRVPITKLFLSTAAVVGTAVLFAACSDSTTSPTPRSLTPGNADLAVVLQQTINSGSNIQYCGYNATQTPTAGTVFAPPAGGGGNCVAAQDLNGALATYNPGWDAGFNANDHWIGPTDHLDPLFPGALSNQYVADVGTYAFQTTFTVPNNAISLTNGFVMNVKSDNAVAVYLNGTFIGGNTPMQDCPTQQTNCNWTSAGAITVTGTPQIGLNTVRIQLLGSAIGFQISGTPRSTCQQGPQFFGRAGFSGPFNVATPQHLTGPNGNLTPNWVIATCKNPTGVDFTAAVSYDIATSTIWCSPGFWKNHLDAWSTTLQNALYNAHGPYPNDPQTFVGYDFGKKVGLSNPTMVEVISNPSIYGGPATNNVASFISNALFGTPITANPAENCPDILPLPGN